MNLTALIKQGNIHKLSKSNAEWELTEDGESPIIYLVKNQMRLTLVNIVVFKYANHVNDLDKDGYSALYYAAICDHFYCRITYFSVLEDNGADLDQVQGNGLTVRQLIRERCIESLYTQI